MSASNLHIPNPLRVLIVMLVASAAYLYPFPQANIVYPAVVAIHALAGLVATIVGAVLLSRMLRSGTILWKAGWFSLAGGALLGLLLIYTGTSRGEFKWLYTHIALSLLGIGCLLADRFGRRKWFNANAFVRLLVCLSALGAIGWAAHYQRENRWQANSLIKNPTLPPRP